MSGSTTPPHGERSTRRPRPVLLAAVGLLTVAGCSGDDPDVTAGSTAGATAAVATTSARPTTGTAPPTTGTAPPTTAPAPPTGAPASTTTTATTAPAPDTSAAPTTTALPTTAPATDVSEFCFDAAQAHVASRAFLAIDAVDPARTEAALERARATLDTAVAVAPTDELAAAPTGLRTTFDRLATAFAAVDYDTLRVQDDADAISDLISLDGLVADLEEVLVATCDADPVVLDAQANELADQIGSEDGVRFIVDESGTVMLDVPLSWTDVDGAPVDGHRAVAVAPDLGAFASSWDAPGVRIRAIDVEPGTADPTRHLDVAEIESACTLTVSDDYDDDLYSGQVRVFEQCGGTAGQVVLVAATDADAAVEIVVEIHLIEDFDVVGLILDSFVVT